MGERETYGQRERERQRERDRERGREREIWAYWLMKKQRAVEWAVTSESLQHSRYGEGGRNMYITSLGFSAPVH